MMRRRLWSLMLLLTGFGLSPHVSHAQDMLPAPKEPVVTITADPGAGPIADSLRTTSMGPACSGPGCAAAGIGCDSCEPARQWKVVLDVGAVYMKRERPYNVNILTDAAGAGVLTENDFNFDWRYGVDARVIADRCDGWGIEARYLWINDFGATQTFAGVPTTAFPTVVPTPFGAPGVATFNYRSEIQSAEVSLRRGWDRFTLVGGFRYIELNENLNANIPFTPATVGTQWNTQNDLWGFQIGADARLLCRSRFRVDGVVRAGLYLNEMDASVARTFTPPIVGLATGNDNSTQLAFAGETGLFATFDVTRNISIKGGYQFLYLSGVALASEQISTTNNLGAGAGGNVGLLINRGDIFYHGAKLGLEIRW